MMNSKDLTCSPNRPETIATTGGDSNRHVEDRNANLLPAGRSAGSLCKVCCQGSLVYDGGDVVCTGCGAVDDERALYMQQEEQHSLTPQYRGHHNVINGNIWSITRSGNGTALLTRDEKEKLGLQTGAYRHTLRSPEEKVVKIIDRVCDRNNLALAESLVKEAVYWATKITNELTSKREKDQVRIKVSPAEISIFSIRKACKTSGISCSTQKLVEAHIRIGYSNIADKKILRNLRRISFVTGIKYETLAPRDYVFNLTNCLISDEGIRSRLANIANPLDYIERRIYSRALEILADIRGEGRNNVMVAAAAICIADRIEGEVLGSSIIAKTLHLDKYKLSLAVERILSQMCEAGKEVKFRTSPVVGYRSQVSGEFARFRQRRRPNEGESQGDNSI